MPFDPIRKKEIADTPEEEIRQALVRWLLDTCLVPRHLMETEFSLSNLQKGSRDRIDVLVHGFRNGGGVATPWLLAECKRVGETDWKALEVQVNKYLRLLRPRHILLGIGAEWRVLSLGADGASYAPARSLPVFPG